MTEMNKQIDAELKALQNGFSLHLMSQGQTYCFNDLDNFVEFISERVDFKDKKKKGKKNVKGK